MFRKCCVEGCDSRRNDAKLHQFPNRRDEKTEIGLKYWLKCVSDGEQKSSNELCKLYVCQKHFEKRFLTPKSRLRRGAYPSLITAAEIANGYSDTANTENYDPNIDHDYCKIKHNDHTYCQKTTKVSPLTLTAFDIEPVTQPSQGIDVTNAFGKDIAGADNTLPEIIEAAVSDISRLKRTRSLTPPSNVDVLPSTSTYYENIITPKMKSKKRRLIKSAALLTPNCKKIYDKFRKTKRKLDFCKCTVKNAKLYSKDTSFETMTDNLTPAAKSLISMQIKQSPRKLQGRRFTNEEKLYCLSIMKQSPKCYRFLKKIFILPSKTTLNKFICGLKIETGINSHVFQAIGREVQAWPANKKYCSILFDEVALEPSISYDKHRDVIEGFVELDKRTNDFADHALVFMLRGAIYKWDQPVAFYYCKGQTSALQLKRIIREIVSAVTETGLVPVALISDQGSSFRSALKNLREESRREQVLAGGKVDDIIIIGGSKLNVIFDPPHLLKGLRNNFLKNNIKYEDKIARWSDYVDVYKTDCKHTRARLLHKLNDEHIIPEKIKKMKVKNCARVFSKTMTAALEFASDYGNYSDGTPISPTLRNTAELTDFLDSLFDSVNGSSFAAVKKGKPLRSVVTKDSKHHTFWQEAVQKLSKMKFVDQCGREKSVPSLNNWILTIKSFERLWHFFSSKGIKIMRPRCFNSDILENFFGQVRAYNSRNNSPDCRTFKNTFRSLLITRFIKFHSKTFSCEDDSGDQLLNLQMLFTMTYTSEETPEPSEYFENLNLSNFYCNTAAQERLNVQSQAYTAGWVIRKILKKIKCSTCEKNLTASQTTSIHKWIAAKDYGNQYKNKLTYPSEAAVKLFKYIMMETIEYLENQPETFNILNSIKAAIKSKYSMDLMACETHENVQEDFLEFAVRFNIFNWCNKINKIMNGTDFFRLSHELPPTQAKARNVYIKRNKSKRT